MPYLLISIFTSVLPGSFLNRVAIRQSVFIAAAIGIIFPTTALADTSSAVVDSEQYSSPTQGEAATPRVDQIAVDDHGIPFILDDSGHVWAFADTPTASKYSNVVYPLVKLPSLNEIKHIEPYIALDSSGNVFTWHRDSGLAGKFYSTPKQYKGIRNATSIAYEGLSFENRPDDPEGYGDKIALFDYIVVVNNRDVFEIAVDEAGKERKPRKLLFGKEIKSISVSPFYTKGPGYIHIAVLMKSGDLLIISKPSADKEAAPPPAQISKLGNFPTASAVSVNLAHVVLLDESGKLTYWGFCETGIQKMTSPLSDVAILEFHGTQNDNVLPYIFIKKDGGVWLWGAKSCDNRQSVDYAKNPQKLVFGESPARQIWFANSEYYLLDANHDLWQMEAYIRWNSKKLPEDRFAKLPLNFSDEIKGDGAAEAREVEKAALIYAHKNTGYKNLRILVRKVVGDYAAVSIIPVGVQGEGGGAYLKKKNGKWVGLDLGTSMDPQGLGIPKEAW